ncbi:serine/threonine-protein kinase [Nonomuraea pusilla]|uniref:non-specific serine/threonine protein kinase n=1 Tax=Nonomuraea pusilla TaxID=46177 RepID=A0A1H8I927_9ACTN|nr:serine/threonine-protein kinase [Nonomuraea pusilla]SEN64655.1 Serine/threonine protein kinase [Nonomuraea pusilla]
MEWSAPGYTDVRQLGSGATGRVVLAVHDETGVKVAIKYLAASLLRDPVALTRFQSEARLLTTLRDPNIATMWEYIQDPGGAAIVMELVNGVSLRALLRENGATGPEAALAVLKGSLLGLARAHQVGLVHKDYKPENVLVRDDGASKLVDFGIAVRQGTAGRAEGTPPYMAPELWEGLPASPATDVYAATAVFFECLTGHRPYRSTEPSVLGYQHLHAPVPLHDAPEPVRELVRRGLAKNPADRPAGARAFLAELEAVAAAAYGEDWEERGRRRLAGLVALLALLLPAPPEPAAQATTSLARTVFGRVRAASGRMRSTPGRLRSAPGRVAMSAGVALVATAAVVVALAARERPATPIDVAAAAPSLSAGTGEPALAPTGPESTGPESTGAGNPEGTDAETPGPAATVTPPGSREPRATPTPARHPSNRPSSRPPNRPPAQPSSRPPATSSSPAPTPRTTPRPTPTRAPATTPATTPTPTAGTPAPPVSVLGVDVGGLTVGDDGEVSARVTLRTSGTAPVTAVATWRLSGDDGPSAERLRLSGARTYTRTLTWDAGERPCGRTVTLTVVTSPAAPGGAASASLAVPPCVTRVTELGVALSMPGDGGDVVARAGLSASGTEEIPVEAVFAVDGEPVATRRADLSGRTSYTPSFTHSFRSRPCGATVSVEVRAGGRTASDRVAVTCPPAVKRVSIVRASMGEDGTLTAVVSVTTGNTEPVAMELRFALGESRGSERVTLSGDTSYTRTVSHAFAHRLLPCGTEWSVSAGTVPAAAGGTDTASGSTPECPSEEPSPPDDSDTPR